jgi:hypothetical protein
MKINWWGSAWLHLMSWKFIMLLTHIDGHDMFLNDRMTGVGRAYCSGDWIISLGTIEHHLGMQLLTWWLRNNSTVAQTFGDAHYAVFVELKAFQIQA